MSEIPSIRDCYDVVVIGGGPAGTTFARLLERRGHAVLVVEKSRHPRFCVGESLLPATLPVWRELGLDERFEKAGFLRKYGAYFCFEDGAQPEYFHFADGSRVRDPHAWEVPRSTFDRLLWDAAVEAGIPCIDRTTVREVVFEGRRATGVELRLPDESRRRVRARLVADCSGRATLLGHQLGIREPDPKLDKIALYCHYDDVIRSSGDDAGTIAIIATPFGWMWLIPFAGGGASVGALMHRAWYRERKQGRDLGRSARGHSGGVAPTGRCDARASARGDLGLPVSNGAAGRRRLGCNRGRRRVRRSGLLVGYSSRSDGRARCQPCR
ncbi:MAG: tryptophan 7-halogenase [Deltaproteobacteria bacterium]|nr:tryptophan 7-halogenase [Deltaproteobacteria bacterium]